MFFISATRTKIESPTKILASEHYISNIILYCAVVIPTIPYLLSMETRIWVVHKFKSDSWSVAV